MAEKETGIQQLEKTIQETHPKALEGLTNTQKRKFLNKLLPRNQNNGVVTEFNAQAYSGPVPHPDLMKGFGEVDDNLPMHIMNMAIDAQKHTQNREVMVINSYFGQKKLGMVLAFVLSLTVIVISGVLIAIDKQLSGYIFGGVGTILLVALLIGSQIKVPNNVDGKGESEE